MPRLLVAVRVENGFRIGSRVVSVHLGSEEDKLLSVRVRRCICCTDYTVITERDASCRNAFCPVHEFGENSGGP